MNGTGETAEPKAEWRLVRWAPWLWTFALAMVVQDLLTVEWAYPYCNDQSDGPAYSGFGFPLPYWQFSNVSSMEDFVMLHVYALDLLLVGLPVFAIVRPLACKLARFRRAVATVSVVCIVVVALELVGVAFLLYVEAWHPVASIASGSYERYRDYRPVFVSEPHDRCPPSEFWFGPRPRKPVAPSE